MWRTYDEDSAHEIEFPSMSDVNKADEPPVSINLKQITIMK